MIYSARRYKNSPPDQYREEKKKKKTNLIFEGVGSDREISWSRPVCKDPVSTQWGVGHMKTDTHLCSSSVEPNDPTHMESSLIVLTSQPLHKETLILFIFPFLKCYTVNEYGRYLLVRWKFIIWLRIKIFNNIYLFYSYLSNYILYMVSSLLTLSD